MILPARIIDLHTHLFNARYVPLASIIAHAMKTDQSILADRAAALLEELAGSSYEASDLLPPPTDPAAEEKYLLDQIWAITRHELLDPTEQEAGRPALHGGEPVPGLDGGARILPLIIALSEVDYAAEGWGGEVPPTLPKHEKLTGVMGRDDVLGWAEKVLRAALKAVVGLMEPRTWGHAENYLEFFLTMLKPEQGLVDKIFKGYGEGLPPVQVVHFMMDMQLAYTYHKPPRYPFHPEQHQKMERLAADNAGRVAGFSAFDPRRTDWRERAQYALDHGFAGFKFYPAMGYTPSNDPDYQATIDAFFDFCVANDAPVFVHCTPNGFQTRQKLGWNAHPAGWRPVLDNPRWENLRLCFGHAGGGDHHNGKQHSAGWMAGSASEWEARDNFASNVVELCVSKPNVYCELGYISELFEPSAKPAFVANFQRACDTAGKFAFLDKVAYGSDWHMPDMVDNLREYLEFFLTLMNQDDYRGHIDNFFWKNAVRYAPRLGVQQPQ